MSFLFYNQISKIYFTNIFVKQDNSFLYAKFYDRGDTIDSYNNIFIKKSNIKRFGSSIIVDSFLYKNQDNKKINFFILKNSKNNKSLDFSVMNLLERLNKKKKIIVLKPLKNGLQVYSSGLLGFLSSKDFFDLILNQKNSIFNILHYYFTKVNYTSLLWFDVNIKKFSCYSFFSAAVFSKNLKKAKIKKTSIFIFKPIKNYE